MPDPVTLTKDPVVTSVSATAHDPGDPSTTNVCVTTRSFNGFTPIDITVCVLAGAEFLADDFFSVAIKNAIIDELNALVLEPSEGWYLNIIQTTETVRTPDADPTYFSAESFT